MISTELFLWVTGIEITVMLAILIPILVQITGLRGEVKPISSLVRSVDNFLRSSGLERFVKGQGGAGHHSLAPEKAAERDTLIAISRERMLLPPEAARLRELLEESARDDFNRGILSLIAFAAILFTIGAIVKALSEE